MKVARRVMVFVLCTVLVAGFIPTDVYVAAKTTYTVSSKAGTYDAAVKTTVKAAKGYKVFYKTSGKFKIKNCIKSGSSKSFGFSKTSTLSLIAVKSAKKINAKKLNSAAYKSKIKKYKYTINQVNMPKFTVKDGVLTGGDFTGAKTIVIPDGVKKIGDSVFEYNKDIESVYFPDTVTEIGESAFNECTGLSRIDLPTSLVKIDKHAFFQCSSLTDVIFEYDEETGEMVTEEIGEGAFFGCTSLKSIEIPGTVTKLGDYVFGSCTALESVSLGFGLTEIPNQMCWQCTALDTILIPDNIKRIGRKAFQYDSGLTYVGSEEELKIDVIDDEAFESCSSLEDISLRPARIGKEAFSETTSLKSLDVLSNAESIGDNAFNNATVGEVNVVIPESLTEVGSNSLNIQRPLGYAVASANPAFTDIDGVLYDKQKKTLVKYPTGLEASSYTVPDGVEIIGANAFDSEEELTEIKLPDSIVKVNDGAFYNCTSLNNIELKDSINSIGASAFSKTGVKNVVIPDSVTEVGKNAWAECDKLESVSVGKGVSKIAEGMFCGDTALKTLKITDKVDTFAPNALLRAGMPYEDIDMGGNTNFLVKDGVLFSGDGKKLISYPSVLEDYDLDTDDYMDSSADAYAEEIASGEPDAADTASGDSYPEDIAYEDQPDEYVKEYKVPDGVEVIGEYAFAGLASTVVNKIYIPDSVKNMEYKSFGYSGNIMDEIVYNFEVNPMSGAYIIGSADSEAHKYALDNEVGFFTEDCSGNATEMSMSIKDKKTFEVKGAVKGAIMYFSDDKSIAKINATTGAITPVAKGTATLIAASGNKYLSCKLNVTDGPAPKKESVVYNEYSDSKSLKKWINTYMAYNNSKAYISKHYPAVREYSGNDYSHIVAAFYGEDDSYFKRVMADLDGDYGQYLKLAKNLSYELHQAKANANLKMFRGTSYVGDITGGGGSLSDVVNAIGKTYVSGSVSSTSLKHSVSSAFSGGGYVLEIDGDKNNIPGMYIASFSQFPNEAELLLANKTTYKVVDAGVRLYHDDSVYGGEDSYEKYIKLKIVK